MIIVGGGGGGGGLAWLGLVPQSRQVVCVSARGDHYIRLWTITTTARSMD